MAQLLYYGDSGMFRKLKQLYEIPSSSPSTSSQTKSEKKSEKSKIRKKTCLENISFMFKENHFQFPPKSSNYHGTNSSCGTNLLFEKMRVFKNVIGVLTWNGDEYFPSQTLTLIDLNRSNSIVHVLELSEDEMICEKVVDFKIGDDFIVCHGESSQLYFIGLYHSNNSRGTGGSGSGSGSGGINYHCEQIPSGKFGNTEWFKCSSNKIVIKTVSQKFYIGEVAKLDQTPTMKPIEQVITNSNFPTVKDAHAGDNFNSVLTETNQVFSMGRFVVTEHRYGMDYIHCGPGHLDLPTTVTNIEKIIGDNHSIILKDANTNVNNRYYLYCGYHHVTENSVEKLIGKLHETVTIENIIPNLSGVGYLVLASIENTKRLMFIGRKEEQCKVMDCLEPVNVDGLFHIYGFPSYFYSVTGFDEDFSFEKCHLTNNFVLFEVDQSQSSKFAQKLAKDTKYSDVEIVTQNEGHYL